MEKDYFHITVRTSVGLLIPITETIEVVTCLRKDVCPIPGVIPPLKGVLNQRGKLLWIMGLGDLLGLPLPTNKKRLQDKLTVVILTPEGETKQYIGAVVSHLKGIISVSPENISPIPEKFRPQARHFLTGITTVKNQKAALVNVAKVFQHFQQSSVYNHSLISL